VGRRGRQRFAGPPRISNVASGGVLPVALRASEPGSRRGVFAAKAGVTRSIKNAYLSTSTP
jgi:hypothetical protein